MDIYLKMDDVEGDVSSDGYDGCISVESFDFGVEGMSMAEMVNPLSNSSSAVLSGVTITKETDKASAALFNLSCSGHRVEKATISFLRQIDDGSSAEYMGYVLDDVLIGSYSISKKPGVDTQPLETIKLVFEKIHFKYIVFDKKGVKKNLLRGGFDIAKGKKLKD